MYLIFPHCLEKTNKHYSLTFRTDYHLMEPIEPVIYPEWGIGNEWALDLELGARVKYTGVRSCHDRYHP